MHTSVRNEQAWGENAIESDNMPQRHIYLMSVSVQPFLCFDGLSIYFTGFSRQRETVLIHFMVLLDCNFEEYQGKEVISIPYQKQAQTEAVTLTPYL